MKIHLTQKNKVFYGIDEDTFNLDVINFIFFFLKKNKIKEIFIC